MKQIFQFNYWAISCFLTENTDYLWDDFDIHAFMNKQIVYVIKNYDNDVLEKTVLDKKTTWIVTWKLKNNCILVKYIAEIARFSKKCGNIVFGKIK